MKYINCLFLLTICACNYPVNSPIENENLDSILSRANKYSFNISEKDSDIQSCYKFSKDNNIVLKRYPEKSIIFCALSKAEARYIDSWDTFLFDNYELLGRYIENNNLSRFIENNGVEALEEKIKKIFFPSLDKELGIQEVEFTIMNSHKIIGNFSFNNTKITDYKMSLLEDQPRIRLNMRNEDVEIDSKRVSFGNKTIKYPIGSWRKAKINYGGGITIIMESITYAFEITDREVNN